MPADRSIVTRSEVGGTTACADTSVAAASSSGSRHANTSGRSAAATTRRDGRARSPMTTNEQAFVSSMSACLHLSPGATSLLAPIRHGPEASRPDGAGCPWRSLGASIAALASQVNDGSSADVILPTTTGVLACGRALTLNSDLVPQIGLLDHRKA